MIKFFFFFLILTSAKSEYLEMNSAEFLGQTREKVKALTTVSPESYDEEIPKLRRDILSFIETKKTLCREGKLAVVTIGETGEERKSGQYLSRKERQACFRELKSFHLSFIKQLHLAQLNYHNYLSEKRKTELKNQQEKTLKTLNKNFDRRIKRGK